MQHARVMQSVENVLPRRRLSPYRRATALVGVLSMTGLVLGGAASVSPAAAAPPSCDGQASTVKVGQLKRCKPTTEASAPATDPSPTPTAAPTPPADTTPTTEPSKTAIDALSLPWITRGPNSDLAGSSTYERLVQVGQLTQATLDAAPDGAVFGVAGGTHRLAAPLRPKPRQGFVGLPGAVISGSKPLTGWTASGNAWYVDGQTQRLPVRDNGGYNVCEPSAPLCERVEDVFVDDVPLRQVASRTELVTGSFWFDDAAKRIWVGTDPFGRRVETTQATQAVIGHGILLRDLVIEKFGNAAQMGAVHGTGLLVERSLIRLNHGTGVFNYGGHVVDSVIVDNGQLGLGAGGADLLVQNNEIARNGRAGYDPGWEAGGTKWAHSTNLIVRGNWSHHNYGNGLWTDINNTRSLYEGNLVEENTFNGIFHEISYSAVIRGNVARRNGTRDTYFNSRVGINVTNSRDVSVYENVVTDNAGGGIIGVQDPRLGGDGPEGTWELERLVVRDNQVRMRPNARGSYSGIWVYDNVVNRASYYTSRGNVFERNQYKVSDTNAKWFLGGDTLGGADWGKTWLRWQELGGDRGGSLVQG